MNGEAERTAQSHPFATHFRIHHKNCCHSARSRQIRGCPWRRPYPGGHSFPLTGLHLQKTLRNPALDREPLRLRLRRLRRLCLRRFLLARSQNGMQNRAFHARHELHHAGIANILNEPVDDVVAQLAV